MSEKITFAKLTASRFDVFDTETGERIPDVIWTNESEGTLERYLQDGEPAPVVGYGGVLAVNVDKFGPPSVVERRAFRVVPIERELE